MFDKKHCDYFTHGMLTIIIQIVFYCNILLFIAVRECQLFSILSWRYEEKNEDDIFLLGGLNEKHCAYFIQNTLTKIMPNIIMRNHSLFIKVSKH